MSKFSIELTNKLKYYYYLTNRTNQISIRNYTQSALSTKILFKQPDKKSNRNNIELNRFDQKRTFVQWSLFGFLKKSKNESEVATNVVPQVIETPPVTSPPVVPATPEITSTTGYIPEPPSLPIEEVILNAIGEPSLQSLGLGSYWTPVGWFQLIFETLHVNFNLSWYASILVFTLLVRTLLIPVSIKMQKKNALMRKSGSVLNRAQEKYSAAKSSGNEMEIYKATIEIQNEYRKAGMSFTSVGYPVLNAVVMGSTFLSIRSMCKLPVESFHTGGILWFQDLTLTDPYYILPLISTATLFVMIKRGVDIGQANVVQTPIMKVFMAALPIIAGVILVFQPCGSAYYIVCSNFFSLGLATILGIPKVKEYLNIPIYTKEEMERDKKESALKPKKSFFQNFSESNKKSKIETAILNMETNKINEFRKYGTKAPVKTYKVNPKELKK